MNNKEDLRNLVSSSNSTGTIGALSVSKNFLEGYSGIIR